MWKYFLVLGLLLVHINLFAQQSLLVQLEKGVLVEEFEKNHSLELEFERSLFRAINLHLFQTTEKISIAQLEQHPSVKRVTPEQELESRFTTPNDPDFGVQWALDRIGAPKAWDVTTGGMTERGDRIVVAVLETGFGIEHEDLAGNIWVNAGEVDGNGIDDDNNGYVDDVHGWNFRGRPQFDDSFHGQSVIGIIGQQGDNGIGGTGVNWNVDLMPLQYRNVTNIFEAYDYVYEMRRLYNESNGTRGAFVVVTNASWGLAEVIPCMAGQMWDDVYEKLGEVGILTVAGVKNDAIDIDEVGDTPSGCPSEFLISVMNTDRFEEKANTSAFGQESVDLAAPGVDIFTTAPNNNYNPSFDGSSSATPHVAGAVALLYSMPCAQLAVDAINKPAETAKLVRSAILNGVEVMSNLSGLNATSGRLNVYNSMIELQANCNPVPGSKLAIYSIYPSPAATTATISYEAEGFDNMQVLVYDAVGKVVIKDLVVPCCQEVNRFGLSVEHLAAGVYFVELVQNEGHVVMRFIKD